MTEPSIITDFDDQDAYKFFMQYAVLKHYPEAKVRYAFILRDPGITFPEGFAGNLKRQVERFNEIRFTPEIEHSMMLRIPWFDREYFNYLRNYRFDPDEVKIHQDKDHLTLVIEGYWHSTILWEVPLLACISELYYTMQRIPDEIEGNIHRWDEKFKRFATLGISVIEFGTRRRKSGNVQQEVIRRFLQTAPGTIKGTSNVMFARRFNIPASGTQAHEWFMFHAAQSGPLQANQRALGKWVETYKGALGIALTDTFTTDVFFREFDLLLSKIFDGIRHDSGDPVRFAQKAIEHYRDKKIVLPNGWIPKTLVFSDGIDDPGKIEAIENAIRNKIFSIYGIGTWLTNDIRSADGTRVTPLNMVIKMTHAKPDPSGPWIPCVKLTDCPEKITGDPDKVDEYIAILK